MAHSYRAVGWNRTKKVYDRTLVLGVLLFLALFVGATATTNPDMSAEIMLMRAFGTGAFVLLHVVLVIGPLCRLDRRWLPLLYNRRHLGVAMFVLGLLHAVLAVVVYHAFGDVDPLTSILSANARIDSLSQFPFQPLGLAAFGILLLMAATSHDFWLANLTPPVWKALHMLVYVAYGLLVMHVALGALQAETSAVLAGLTGAGLLLVTLLHVIAALREAPADVPHAAAGDRVSVPHGVAADQSADDCWVAVCPVDSIPEGRAHITCLAGERVAVFRWDGRVAAVSNACQHQNGPLGEGRVIDGCITCPWHGYQYLPASGRSPPPFDERVPTFAVRVEDGHVLIDPRPRPPGTELEPAIIGDAVGAGS